MNRKHLFGMLCIALLLTTPSCNTARKVQQTPQPETTQSATRQQYNTDVLPDSLLNGEWLFTEACDQPVVGDKTVQITFDTATHRIFGNNGCNVFNGSLILGEGNEMSFGNCITTMMACRPEVTDRNIMTALNSTTHYVIAKQAKDELVVNLLNSEGAVVATISRQLRELLNGYWDIIEVNGKPITLEELPTAVLDITTKKLTGNSGCNLMNGSIEYDATSVNNGIKFSHIASTRRMCAPEAMQVENAILNALNNVDAFRFIDGNCIGLYKIPEKNNLLVLRRK